MKNSVLYVLKLSPFGFRPDRVLQKNFCKFCSKFRSYSEFRSIFSAEISPSLSIGPPSVEINGVRSLPLRVFRAIEWER